MNPAAPPLHPAPQHCGVRGSRVGPRAAAVLRAFPSPAFPPRGRGRARFQVRLKNPDRHQGEAMAGEEGFALPCCGQAEIGPRPRTCRAFWRGWKRSGSQNSPAVPLPFLLRF